MHVVGEGGLLGDAIEMEPENPHLPGQLWEHTLGLLSLGPF